VIPVPEPTDIERGLQVLEVEIKKLEAEYNMYFSGRLPKPPWETRSRVDAMVKQFDRSYIQNYGDRFRFNTLQSRYASLVDLWDRGLRAREEGRAGPFAQKRTTPADVVKKPEDKILRVAAFRDPNKEMDKLRELYDSVAEARKAVGDEPVPFHRFADLVKSQVKKLKAPGTEVTFRVSVKDGKVNFTAKAVKPEKT
jgi:hypothetical protein